MSVNNKVENIFSYLLSIKNMNEKIIRNVEKYEKVYWQKDIESIAGCTIDITENKEEWLIVDKNAGKIYEQLSKIYLQLQKNSENLEIVLGNGILTLNIDGEKICHPILTTKMELSFNQTKEQFMLKSYNNRVNVELDILNGFEICTLENILNVKNSIRQLGIDIRFKEEVAKALAKVYDILNIKQENIYFNGDILSSEKMVNSEEIKIYNSPIIILRKVDTRLWNMELTEMLEKIREGYDIPRTIEALTSNAAVKQDVDTFNKWKEVGDDLLFPLAANEEQKEIVKRLAENFGVVVQGPPGTGKSHTIVNLVCHLLAHGKRVLVTSQTDRALKVLSNMLPEEIKPLCISILGDDTKALEELDESVRKITEQIAVDTKELKEEAKLLKYKLNKCREKKQKLNEKLKEVESKENSIITYEDEKYTIKNMAKWINDNKSNSAWIEDSLNFNTKMPLSHKEFKELLELLARIKDEELKDANKLSSYINKIGDKNEVCKKIREFYKLTLEKSIYEASIENWNNIDNIKYDNKNLLRLLEDAIENLWAIEDNWLGNVMKHYYSSEMCRNSWIQLVDKCNEYLKSLSDIKQKLNLHKVELPKNIDINKFKKDLCIVSKEIDKKGKIGVLFKKLNGSCKYILEQCLVDYESIANKEQIETVNLFIAKEEIERNLKNVWNNTVKEYGGKTIVDSDLDYLIFIEEQLVKIELIMNWNSRFKERITYILKEEHFNREMNWYKKDTYIYVKTGLESIKALKQYENLKSDIHNIRNNIPKVSELRELDKAIEELDLAKIEKIYGYMEDLKVAMKSVDKINSLSSRLQQVCPSLLNRLYEEKNKVDFISKYENFDKAWQWKIWNDYLNNLVGINIHEIEEAIKEESLREVSLIKELVSKKSWYNQITRTTEEQKRSLFTWMEAIKRIGKGTGTQAVKYRKLAQKEMENCKDVIPVWIMPINRVIENLKPGGELFDVVIVDESSQSDISAITALMRAKKAVIVGDEKQISPEAIGKDNSMVETLIETYLKDIPHSEWFDLKTSLYNTALRVFPNRLLLKEHFRCVPEIINFSNEFCYSNEIIPLRCAKGRDILSPSITNVKVENGFRDENKSLNINEANAIVNKIVDCCKSEKYNGMTMGVISLLGEAQAELIENMLLEQLGMDEILKRKLICGDAYSFQGDERDIMFLSMVIANNAKFAALTKSSDIRRFNVAASRAKNQMWLFHSVDLEDLNDKCIRYGLLRYCMDKNKNNDDKFKNEYIIMNDFQKEIYKYISEKGYLVTPQFQIGRYKIDFVVENKNQCIENVHLRKFAIECVGGKEEEEYNWDTIHERQLCLERVGWEFYKIRSSEFYNKKEITLDKLMQKLKQYL